MWQRRCGYCPATAGTLGTAAAMVELGNPGLEGGGSGSFRARWEGGRIWTGFLAKPLPGLYRAILSS